MFSAEPQRTQFDLNFELFGIPVRVHPLFWLMGLLLGGMAGGLTSRDAVVHILIWVAVLFFSILVHELGHALTMRYFGSNARIVLYMMGGLAIPESSPYGEMFTNRSRSPWNQILILIAGPGAGFLLAGTVVAAAIAARLKVSFELLWHVVPYVYIEGIQNPYLGHVVSAMLYVNIFWGLVNLLPVFPLDGGQIARELFVMQDPRGGLVKSLWLSVIVGAFIAVVGLAVLKSFFMAIMFGSLAFTSWQILQSFTGRGGGGYGRPW